MVVTQLHDWSPVRVRAPASLPVPIDDLQDAVGGRDCVARSAPLDPAFVLGLAEVLASADDAIYSENTDGVVTSWNRGAERLYGWSADAAVGRPSSTF